MFRPYGTEFLYVYILKLATVVSDRFLSSRKVTDVNWQLIKSHQIDLEPNMKTEKISTNMIDNFPSLSMALVRLMEGKEKSWGYFQIAKKDSFYHLTIPSLPILKYYQNSDNYIYRAFWLDDREARTEEKPKKAPSIHIKKKQRKIFVMERKNRVEKIEKIFEIVCKHEQIEGVQIINKILANLIKDEIEERISSYKMSGEVKPRVVITEEF
jgi:hypothetical protein